MQRPRTRSYVIVRRTGVMVPLQNAGQGDRRMRTCALTGCPASVFVPTPRSFTWTWPGFFFYIAPHNTQVRVSKLQCRNDPITVLRSWRRQHPEDFAAVVGRCALPVHKLSSFLTRRSIPMYSSKLPPRRQLTAEQAQAAAENHATH